MRKDQNWSAFAAPTKEELKELKKLINVNPSLVSTLSINDNTEYRVYYNNEETNELQYMYIGSNVKEKEIELMQMLKNSSEFEEMIESIVEKRILKKLTGKTLEELAGLREQYSQFFGSTVATEDTKVDTIDGGKKAIKDTSQYNYYFDCGNGGKGSFACLWQKGGEYFILTAAHNLQNGKVTKKEAEDSNDNPKKEQSIYQLKKDVNNTVSLKLDDHGWQKLDWARLKLVKNIGTEEKPNWVPMTKEDIEGTKFYKNCIDFDNMQDNAQHQGRETKGDDEQTGDILVAYKTCIYPIHKTEQHPMDYSKCNENKAFENPDNDKFWKILESGEGGNSGGAFFDKESQNLVGLYIGTATHTNTKKLVGRVRNIV